MSRFITIASVLALFVVSTAAALAAPAGSILFGQTSVNSGVAVHYNGTEEIPANQAYLRSQQGLENPNGAEFRFDNTLFPVPGTIYQTSWSQIFESNPGQFGLDIVLPVSSGAPSLNAYDWNGSTSSAAEPVMWAINNYWSPGPSSPSNSIVHTAIKGDTVSVVRNVLAQTDTGYSVDIAGWLISDGYIDWYGDINKDTNWNNDVTALSAWGLSDNFWFEGTLNYTYNPDRGIDPLGVDFYKGSVSVYAAPAPAVPEPMSIMLGIMGLGSIAGFRKIRK